MGFLVCRSVFLRASGIDVNEVSVRVILVGVAVACLPALVRSGFRAVVHVTDVVKLEFLSFLLSVGVRQVIAHVQCAFKLQVTLRQVLALRGDAVHVVVAHCQCVACRLAVCTRVGSGCACQTVQCVVGVAVAHLSAGLAALWQGRSVGHAEHVAHGVVGVGVVHYGASAGVNLQTLQSATLQVIGVECLRSVAVLHVRALPELVVAYAVHVVVAV